jgi:L-ascorbate metabolism protein UlaG (beta-lactamase superfamily)
MLEETLEIAIEDRWKRFMGLDRIDSGIVEKRIRSFGLDSLSVERDKPQIVWLGHASFLLVWKGRRILIDPVFSTRVGIMPRRFPVPMEIDRLEPDAILLSHAHMDHFDNATLARFPDAEIYLPRGSERFLKASSRKRVSMLGENEQIGIGAISLRCVPALHGGWRYPWQKGFHAFGYLLSDGKTTVYFAGDTAYGGHFRSLGMTHNIDIAMLPIGAYSPRWFLKSRHLNPDESIRAFHELGAKTLIPYHFGTYRLSLEPLSEPLPWFAAAAEMQGIDWSLSICP